MKLNGNLTFHTLGDGEIQNAVIERMTTATRISADVTVDGRLVFDTTTGTYFFASGSSWVEIATGGNAAALQVEVDAIEASLGTSLVDSSGVFNSTGANLLTNVTGATDIYGILSQLDGAISTAAGVDTLPELTDVTITGLAANELLFTQDGSTWVNQTLAEADIASATSFSTHTGDDTVHLTSAQNTLLDGLAGTLTSTELNFVDGVTSGIQGQLDNKQPLDAELTALAGLTGTGIVVKTGAGTFTERSIVESNTNAIIVTNGDGVAGNPSLAVEAGLDSIAGITFAADQMIYSTADNTFAATALSTAARSLLDDASTADMRTTLGLVDGGAGDTWVNLSGDTMTGALILSGNPTLGTHAANKDYVDATVAGLTWKNSAVARTTGDVVLATGGLLTIDGVGPLVAGDRVLVAAQTAGAENGIYVVAAGAWVRSTDFDSVSPIDEINSAAVFVEQGTTYADSGWTVTSNVVTLDTDTITFTQFNGAAGVTAGVGLAKTGNTLDINMGAGIVALPTDEVGIDLYDAAGGALILTTDGSTRGTATGDQLYLELDSTTLVQSSAGLKVASGGITDTEVNASAAIAFSKLATLTSANILVGSGAGVASSVAMSGDVTISNAGVTTIGAGAVDNTMMANSTVTFQDDAAATDAVALGETVSILGTDAIDTAVTANTMTISVKDATSAQKGVATFNTANFTVTSGDVTLNSSLDDLTNVSGADAGTDGQVMVKGATDWSAQSMYYLYTGVSATSHTVTHSLGQQFCNVTVVDAADEVIIPQSITFTSANVVTVVFNTAIACKVIVMGIA